MSNYKVSVVWPITLLDSVIKKFEQQTAIILVIKNVNDFKNQFLISGLASSLVKEGVKLFALVGKESELAHDALDCLLLEIGAEKVITSFHEEGDPEDVASFAIASCKAGGLTQLVLAIDELSDFGKELKKSIHDISMN